MKKWLLQCILAAVVSACGGSDGGDDLPAGTNCGVDTYANYAQAFFTTNCNTCHSAANYKLLGGGEIELDTQALVKQHQADVIDHAVKLEAPIMPSGSTTGLPIADRNRLQNWFACKAP